MLYKYKRENGKAYQRINFYIRPSRDYNDYTVNELADVFAESSQSDKEAVTSDGEIVDLTYKTDTSETTSNVAAIPGNLSTILTVTNSVNARLKQRKMERLQWSQQHRKVYQVVCVRLTPWVLHLRQHQFHIREIHCQRNQILCMRIWNVCVNPSLNYFHSVIQLKQEMLC